jgi:hypothetical protein
MTRTLIHENVARIEELVTAMTKEGSTTLNQYFVSDLLEGEEEATRNLSEMLDYVGTHMEKIGFGWKEYCNTQEKLAVRIDSRTIEIKTETVMALNMHIQSSYNMKSLFKAKEMDVEDIGTVLLADEINKFYRDFSAACALLAPIQLAMCNFAGETYLRKMLPIVNKISLTMLGHETCKPHTGDWPVLYSNVPTEEQNLFYNGGRLSFGMNDVRVAVVPFFSQLLQCIQIASYSHAMSKPMHNVRVIISDKGFRKTCEDAGYRSELDLIIERVATLNRVAYGEAYAKGLSLQYPDNVLLRIFADRVGSLRTQWLPY